MMHIMGFLSLDIQIAYVLVKFKNIFHRKTIELHYILKPRKYHKMHGTFSASIIAGYSMQSDAGCSTPSLFEYENMFSIFRFENSKLICDCNLLYLKPTQPFCQWKKKLFWLLARLDRFSKTKYWSVVLTANRDILPKIKLGKRIMFYLFLEFAIEFYDFKLISV